jgi:hypothetical protein
MKGISERYNSIRKGKKIQEGFVSQQLTIGGRNARNDKEGN